MNIIDFRFRPNTPEIIDGIRNSNMFRAACKAIGFDARQPQPLDEIVEDLDRMGVELGVITGRDSETTYGSPSNNGSVLSFCRAYPNKFVGFWGIDPHKGMAAVREIVRAVEELGLPSTRTWPIFPPVRPVSIRYTPSARNWACRCSSPWPPRRRCRAQFLSMPIRATWIAWPGTFPN